MGVCAIACVLSEDIKHKVLGIGATIIVGTGSLAIAKMYDKKIKRELCTQDKTKLSDSMKQLKECLQEITH